MCRHELLDEEHAVKINCGLPEAGVRRFESTTWVQQASDVLIMATVQEPEDEHHGMSTRHGEEDGWIGQVLESDENLGSGDMLALAERTPFPRDDCASWVQYTQGSRERVRSAG